VKSEKEVMVVDQLVDIYVQSLIIAVIIEICGTLIGVPFAILHKIKNEENLKEYLVDALVINLLTSPLFAFGILAITYILKVRNLS
jgi:ABC-type dipeptide/oligopeptide/nickel transport system permease component